MLQGLVSSASQLLNDVRRSLLTSSRGHRPHPATESPARLSSLQRVVLTDGVGRTLFEEYASHRADDRGHEETGWLLLGLREANHAVALATLPAGAQRDAGVSHVRFNSTAQALAGRIVRQADRRLTILGLVHTHPGTLRHPSDGDLRGDRVWVERLRGQEGVFAIGTADGTGESGGLFAEQPRPHMQCLGDLRFCWYALGRQDRTYRPLPVEVTLGPDLARKLHLAWPTLEAHAERLERLIEQQAGWRIEVVAGPDETGLQLVLPLAGRTSTLRVLLSGPEVRYFLERDGDIHAVEMDDPLVDRGVYLLLARLTADH